MAPKSSSPSILAGDIDGLHKIYSESGTLIPVPGESTVAERENCEFAAFGSWRPFFPKSIFHALPGSPSGKLYVTNQRLVFLRGIDIWKEVKPLLTPLSLPTAAEKEARFKKLKSMGAHQYCVVYPAKLTLANVKRKPWVTRFRLISKSQQKYEVFVHTDVDDLEFFDALEKAVRELSNRTT